MRIRTIALLLAALPAVAAASDWPQFRGPNAGGTSDEKNLPDKFTATDGLRWKVALPARGVSSPVVVGGKVFVTCSGGLKDDRLHVLAFDAATGAKLWHRQYAATGGTQAHPKTCMAAPTPVADAKAVYALFATGDVAALDHDGNQLWYRSLTGDYPSISNQVGMASSPTLFKDRLIVPMENSGESFIAALDTATGKNVWKTERPREANWTTPVVREMTSEKAEVLFAGPKGLVAYDMGTGAKAWTHKGGASVGTPTLADGLLVLPTDGATSVCKLGGDKPEEQWASPKLRTGYSSPLYFDGKVYACTGTGIVYCVDAKTGTTAWDYRVPGSKQAFSASPVAADGKVYVLTEKGTLAVLKAGGTEAEELGVSEIGEEGLGSPAISGGAVFVRTDKSLLCIGAKVKK